MEVRPAVRYCKAPDGVTLACQVLGEGPINLLSMGGGGPAVDLMFEEAGFANLARRLARFSRSAFCDARGTGASGGDATDRYRQEIVTTDLVAWLDTLGFEKAVIVGYAWSGPQAIHFTAARPERVSSLVLIDTFAHYVREPGYPVGVPPERLEPLLDAIAEEWGTGGFAGVFPSRKQDTVFLERMARYQRLGTSPEGAAESARLGLLQDVRSILGEISVPTLIIHQSRHPLFRVEAGQYLAAHIPDSRLVVLPGDEFVIYMGNIDALADEVEEFLTGSHQGPEGDVVTATIMFTDIVASTQQAAKLGHRKWTATADEHDAMVRSVLQRHRGREVKTVGDGFLATFDSSSRAVRAAAEIVNAAHNMDLEVRAGVHIGEVEVRPDDVVGLTVSITKRICDLAGPGQVFVSRQVTEMVIGSGIEFAQRGEYELKGVPGSWRLFAVA